MVPRVNRYIQDFKSVSKFLIHCSFIKIIAVEFGAIKKLTFEKYKICERLKSEDVKPVKQ